MSERFNTKDAVLHIRRYISTISQPEHLTQAEYEETLDIIESDLMVWRGAAKQGRTPERPVPVTRVG